jgi:hypothetical protein
MFLLSELNQRTHSSPPPQKKAETDGTITACEFKTFARNFTSAILQAHFYKRNFTRAILKAKFYKRNFTGEILQA